MEAKDNKQNTFNQTEKKKGDRPTHDISIKTAQFGGKEVNYRIAALWDNGDHINFGFPRLIVKTTERGIPTLYAEVKHYGQPARIELARFSRIESETFAFEGNLNDMVAFKRSTQEQDQKKALNRNPQPKP